PQSYYLGNAWSIPLHPVPAANGMSAKTNFFRGAIAVAANGIPIFNPIKNDGRTDTFLAGELDEYGGHCGRADDYHYHVAPWHLAERLGPSLPLGYALDGYPIYGLAEPDGSTVSGLDSFHGHTSASGEYHYHASKSYPYINGGFHGEVSIGGGQVEPQPSANPVRQAGEPLPGAKITGFTISADKKKYQLDYSQNGRKGSVNYEILPGGSVHFTFKNPDGTTSESTSEKGKQRKSGDRPPPPPDRKAAGGPPQMEANGQPRKPWIENHLKEMDGDQDGKLSREEMMAEVNQTFTGYDADGDGKISSEEANGPGVRSSMAGFVKQHFTEVDADGSGSISLEELKAVAMKMWEKYSRGEGFSFPRSPTLEKL
ncbi:MAG: YHYH protein, partial [Verrucomicrobiota bacterium]